jgi:hypothetical protein
MVSSNPFFLQFCVHVSSLFRSDSSSPTANPSFKLSSSRLISILDDCCGSIQQLKIHAADSFTFTKSSSLAHILSPSMSQFLRLSCATAATSARMVAVASPARIPLALAFKRIDDLAQFKVLFLRVIFLFIQVSTL